MPSPQACGPQADFHSRRLIRFRSLTPTDGIYKALAYAIRPTKLGNKNWMFMGGEHTG